MLIDFYRGGGIRTHDLKHPKLAHYQAVLRPDGADHSKSFSMRSILSFGTRKLLRCGSCVRALLRPGARSQRLRFLSA